MAKKTKNKVKVLEELDGKSQKEQTEIIRKHILGKDYKNREFEAITDEFKDNPTVITVIIESLRTLKETTNKLSEKQEKAFDEACSVAKATINNPNSTAQERMKAIELVNNCYKMLTVVNIMIILAIVTVIIIILKETFGVVIDNKDKNK